MAPTDWLSASGGMMQERRAVRNIKSNLKRVEVLREHNCEKQIFAEKISMR
jgi:hypothetical protein